MLARGGLTVNTARGQRDPPEGAMVVAEPNATTTVDTHADVLVLAVGNTLLSDDGVGPLLLGALQGRQNTWRDLVEFIDGGTQGLALLPYISDRTALVILDAVALGDKPGTIHELTGDQVADLRTRRAATAHEGNAGDLLATARLLGDCPEKVYVVGIEPDTIRTGLGVSEAVARSIHHAVERTVALINEILTGEAHVPRNPR
jgi:hydrogenase maturation protease